MISDLLSVLRVVIAALLSVLGLLALFRIPHIALWKPAIVATEAGHLLAPVALMIALSTLIAPLGARSSSALVTFCIAIAASLLLLTPLVRAIGSVERVSDELDRAFGESPRARPIHVDRLFRLATPASADLEQRRFVTADGSELRMDLYRGAARSSERRPIVIVIHGGSWQSGDERQLPDLNHYLAERGFAVAAISYRLAPEHTFPAPIEDVGHAINALKRDSDELGVDTQRIVLLGRSAGAQIALSAAYNAIDVGVRGVVSLYGPTDMHWSWDNPSHPWILDSSGSLKAYLGGTPDEVGAIYHAASPIQRVSRHHPVPTLLVHGGRDELVYAYQSERMAARLAEAAISHAYIQLPWATHVFDANLNGPGGQLFVYALERFLDTLFPEMARPQISQEAGVSKRTGSLPERSRAIAP